jgi:hypothetical protein
MVSIDLGDEDGVIVDRSQLGDVKNGGTDPDSAQPMDSEEQHDGKVGKGKVGGDEDEEKDEGEPCENCAEYGHCVDECPHRNSSEEEEDELDSGEDY